MDPTPCLPVILQVTPSIMMATKLAHCSAVGQVIGMTIRSPSSTLAGAGFQAKPGIERLR
jgi:hypothetical protein